MQLSPRFPGRVSIPLSCGPSGSGLQRRSWLVYFLRGTVDMLGCQDLCEGLADFHQQIEIKSAEIQGTELGIVWLHSGPPVCTI